MGRKKAIISSHYVSLYWNPSRFKWHWFALAPFVAVHAAYKKKNGSHSSWCWDERSVQECLGACWNMTGEWKARRAITCSRSDFDRRLLKEVPRLSKIFNKHKINCMGKILDLHKRDQEKVLRKILNAIEEISRLRKTKLIQPVLGSKVLHHFFPSVIPVFDERFIKNGVMRLDEFQNFIANFMVNNVLNKFVNIREIRMIDYYKYIMYCIDTLSKSKTSMLKSVRKLFGIGYQDFMPHIFTNDKNSLLWKMDAKIIEYCLVGRAYEAKFIEK
jgi:hypothetical protein